MTGGQRPWRRAVTGASGFVGSHLVARLARDGYQVVGLDEVPVPREADFRCGATDISTEGDFSFRQCDLAVNELVPLLRDVDTVFHLAGVSGVRESWGSRYADYVHANILGTQRLLEACREAGVRRVVVASSSSVYGSTVRPSRIEDLPQPVSPYGVSKLAVERLALAYAEVSSFDACILRYFTVYGPYQRPTMLMSRILQAAHTGHPVTVFGDGSQRRHFTYVDDAVEATVLAGTRPLTGSHVVNVAGPRSASVSEVLAVAESVIGAPIRVHHGESQAGDVTASEADLSEAYALLGYRPRTDLAEGIAEHWECYHADATVHTVSSRIAATATGGAL
ncbi:MULTISPECIES: NAD(P)-dependent oxidoreductase [Nocardiopsis]|uniref:NAD-dependent epimerase/dehydratase family protein n=1 Tax=Nocardiopsis TaxID=2013 RepID=UPI0021113A4F|nr:MULTISPECIES: NAD-dependent epimerase/dehydratase family protein [Nocardiopsis]WDZ92811.1 NAD-dependent epimerase/dehydratase family protein [Nocardiopsis sp. HUAS JQ3]